MPSTVDHDAALVELINAANPQPSALSLEIVAPEPGLLCWVFINNSAGGFEIPRVTGIVYGATPVVNVFTQQNTLLSVGAFELIAPPVGTANIQVTLSAIGGDSAEIVIVAQSLTYIDQTKITGGNFSGATGDGTDASTALGFNSPGAIKIGGCIARIDHDQSPLGASDILLRREISGFGSLMVKAALSRRPGDGGASLFRVGNGGPFDEWALVQVPVFFSGTERAEPGGFAPAARVSNIRGGQGAGPAGGYSAIGQYQNARLVKEPTGV